MSVTYVFAGQICHPFISIYCISREKHLRYEDEIPVFPILDMRVQNKKYGYFVFISRLTAK